MITLTIRHETAYRYARPVSFNEHRAMFRPLGSHDLRLLEAWLSISPPATVRWHHDVFGNSIAVASFEEPADTLRLESRIQLEHYALDEPEFPVYGPARKYPFSYPPDIVPDLGQTRDRHYPDPDGTVDAWARSIVQPGMWTGDLLLTMTQRIANELRYETRDEEGTQTPAETLARGAGTCRDFALLMIEAARGLGFAARFVSGYLYDDELTRAAGGTIGGGSTHAWVQIYLPGAGWMEFDPTNGLAGGKNLIRVAVARDPKQAIPLTGSYNGRPDDFLEMSVNVEVTVQ